DVRGHHAGPAPRRQHGGQPEAGADLPHTLAGPERQLAAEQERAGLGGLHAVGDAEHAVAIEIEERPRVVAHLPCTFRKYTRSASLSCARAPAEVCASSSVSSSMASGTPSFLTPSSSAVSPHRSSDSVKTSLAR